MKNNNVISLIIIIALILCLFIIGLLFLEYYSLIENSKIEEKSNKLLMYVQSEIEKLVFNIQNNINSYKPFEKYINRLRKKVLEKKINFVKNIPTDKSKTSYTVNSGETIALCVNDGNKLIDVNTVIYVTLHELAHVACEYPQCGINNGDTHTEEFDIVYAFLVLQAIKYGIYKYVDYSHYPQMYCGLLINANVLSKFVTIN